MAYETCDLLNELGSSNIPLPQIERRVVDSLESSPSREDQARSIEAAVTGYLEESLEYAATYEEKARNASAEAELHQRQAEGFHNSAVRAKTLLERLASNPDWPEGSGKGTPRP